MSKLKVVFTKSRKFMPLGSWFIRLFTWRAYSHVALEINMSFLEKPMYFHSNEGKVNYEYKDHFDREHEIVSEYEIKIDEKLYNEMKIKRLKHAGENYGTWQNFGIIIVDILKFFGIRATNPWKKGKNCSEIVYEVVFKKMHPDLDYDPNTIKPHHIEKILTTRYRETDKNSG